jgi:hypothetical protein
VRADYVLHLLEATAPLHQAELSLSWSPPRVPLGVAVEARQRPLTDMPRAVQDLGLLYGIGAGGMPVSQLVDRFQTREVDIAMGSSPWQWLRLFAVGTAGWLNDGNTSRTCSASVSVLAIRTGGLELWARYGLWYADYARMSVDYWAPRRFAVHQPTVEARLSLGEVVDLSTELGLPISPDALGLHAAGRLDWQVTDALDLGAGVLASSSVGYRITAMTVRFGGRL